MVTDLVTFLSPLRTVEAVAATGHQSHFTGKRDNLVLGTQFAIQKPDEHRIYRIARA